MKLLAKELLQTQVNVQAGCEVLDKDLTNNSYYDNIAFQII